MLFVEWQLFDPLDKIYIVPTVFARKYILSEIALIMSVMPCNALRKYALQDCWTRILTFLLNIYMTKILFRQINFRPTLGSNVRITSLLLSSRNISLRCSRIMIKEWLPQLTVKEQLKSNLRKSNVQVGKNLQSLKFQFHTDDVYTDSSNISNYFLPSFTSYSLFLDWLTDMTDDTIQMTNDTILCHLYS